MKKHRIGKWILWLGVLCLAGAVLIKTNRTVNGLWRELRYYTADTSPAQQTVMAYARENGLHYSQYPQSLIDLLERNPETERFVLEYPLLCGTEHRVDLSEYADSETVPLFMQWDQRWGYIEYGGDVAGVTGCGPVCLSMAAIYVTGDTRLSPDFMLRFAAENGYCVPGSGSSWTLISEGGVALGLDVTEIPLDQNRIFSNLEVDNPIICAMGPGDFTSSGHFIVLTGLEDGLIRVNDPNSTPNSQTLWDYDEIRDQIRNLWVIRE